LQAFLSASNNARVIWFGYSTFLLSFNGTTVLVDPVFSTVAAPVSFMVNRFQLLVLSLQKLPPVDIVLISHDHYDHLDRESVQYFVDESTEFVTPLGVGAHLIRWGIDAERITERDWWQSYTTKGIQFTAAPARMILLPGSRFTQRRVSN